MKIYHTVNERTNHEVEVRISENYISVYRFVSDTFGYINLYEDEYEGNLVEAIQNIIGNSSVYGWYRDNIIDEMDRGNYDVAVGRLNAVDDAMYGLAYAYGNMDAPDEEIEYSVGKYWCPCHHC